MSKMHAVSKSAKPADERGRVLARCGKPSKTTTTVEESVTCPQCQARRPMTAQAVVQAETLVAQRQAGDALDERSVYVSLTQRAIGIRRRIDVALVSAAPVEVRCRSRAHPITTCCIWPKTSWTRRS